MPDTTPELLPSEPEAAFQPTIPTIPATMTAESASASTHMKKIANWDGTSEDINQTLIAAFEAEDYSDCIMHLRPRGIRPQSYIDSLDEVSLYSSS